MKKFQKGFTLIELLVVIAIIGILASVVVSSVSSAKNKATIAAFKAEVSSIQPAGIAACDGGTSSTSIGLPTFKYITTSTNVCTGDGTFSVVATPTSAVTTASSSCTAITVTASTQTAFPSGC